MKQACCSLKNKHVKRHFGVTGETERWSPALLLQGLSLPQEHRGLKSAAFWEEDVVLTVCHKKWLLYKTTSSFPLRSKIFNSSCSCSNWKSCSDSFLFYFFIFLFLKKSIPACNWCSWRAAWKSGQLIWGKLRSHWNKNSSLIALLGSE